jgi:hypothetical protein
MKAVFTFIAILLSVQVFAQRPEPTGSADRNQPLLDPTQFQPPPPPIDTVAPMISCLGGQFANVFIVGAISIWSTDLITSLSDNMTPLGELKTAIRKAGTGTGFPMDAAGNPIDLITYNCQELGIQQMEVWAIDGAGNAGYCTTEVLISDQYDYCNQSYDSVMLCVKRPCDNSPMPGTIYNADGSSTFVPNFNQIPLPPVTDSTGCGIIYIPEGTTATVTVERDDDPLNGLTTLDMLLIAKHILGLQPLADPYRLIAADANKSGSVTSFDIVEFQKLIKGIYTELPVNTSWRFVDADFQFPNPFNPFMSSFPEAIVLFGSGGYPDTVRFFGIKIGDVNCSATYDSLYDPDYPDVNLVIKDTLLQAGQEYEMPIYPEVADSWAGYQFALDFDPAKLEVTGIVPTQWTDAGDWGFLADRITTSWAYAPHPVDFGPNQPISIVRVKALQPLALTEVLQLATTSVHAEAYRGNDAEPFDLLLTFAPQFKAPELPIGERNAPGSTMIGDVYPNPAEAGAMLPVQLNTRSEVTIASYALQGQLIWKNVFDLDAGTHILDFPAEFLQEAGVYVWRVQAGDTVKTGKLILK